MPSGNHLPARTLRQRNRYTHAQAKRTRPSTPAPTDGWVIADLVRLTGVTLRTLRHYVSVGLLRPLEFRGTATRYPRRELLRLLKLLALKSESRGKLVLSDVKSELDSLAEPELEAWLSSQSLPSEVAAALGVAPNVGAEGARPSVQVGLEGAVTETWRRVQLLPGLELMLSSAASPAVQSVARTLYAEYVGRGSG